MIHNFVGSPSYRKWLLQLHVRSHECGFAEVGTDLVALGLCERLSAYCTVTHITEALSTTASCTIGFSTVCSGTFAFGAIGSSAEWFRAFNF